MPDVRKSIGVLGLSLGVSLLSAFSAPAHAQANLSSTADASLLLMIWDPVNKVSYSRDTGLNGLSLYNGLSDAGSQQFWTIDPATDTSFAKFSQVSTDLSKDIWMVVGVGQNLTGAGPGTSGVYTTMINTVLGDDNQPILNPEWPALTGVTNSKFRGQLPSAYLLYQREFGNGTPYNNYATAPAGTGSSFDTPGQSGYITNMAPILTDATTGEAPGDAMFGTGGFDTGNLLGANGSSSWFYYMTPSSSKSISLTLVSAYANSGELAYWGLARTTNASNQQELVLSFTLPSAITPASTTLGILRRNQTDYTAQYGSAVQIGVGDDEFQGWTPSPLLDVGSVAAAVPEPDSVLLMALGLGGVLAAVRRSRRLSRRPARG